MKNIIFRILLSIAPLIIAHPPAIVQVSANVNIGLQPNWGPTGYNRADYYYLPDVESYYSIATHQFIYLSNGRWIYATALPAKYKNYDLYSGYKVVVNRPRPYLNFSQDRVQYNKYKSYKGKQQVYRDVSKRVVSPNNKKSDNKHTDNNGHDYGPA